MALLLKSYPTILFVVQNFRTPCLQTCSGQDFCKEKQAQVKQSKGRTDHFTFLMQSIIVSIAYWAFKTTRKVGAMGLRRVVPESRWRPSEPTIFEVSTSMESDPKLNNGLKSIASKGPLVNGVNGTNGVKAISDDLKSKSADWNEEYEQVSYTAKDVRWNYANSKPCVGCERPI